MMKLMLLAATLVVEGPASVDGLDRDELLFGLPAFSVIDDVDVDNVHERNPLNRGCVADDIELDGSIAGYEITCYV